MDSNFDHALASCDEFEVAPTLRINLAELTTSFQEFSGALPGIRIHYATKCNPAIEVLQTLARLGSSFEIASVQELQTVISVGVSPSDVLFSNPVRSSWQTKTAYQLGVRNFSFDSIDELQRLNACAPHSTVHLRLATPLLPSDVPSEGKFGVLFDQGMELVRLALKLDLDPSGLAFHVGSQMTSAFPWSHAIAEAGRLMEALLDDGHRFDTLNIGGGFPARYETPVESITAIGEAIESSIADLPYEVKVLAEPGRAIVAGSGELRATVIGVATRRDTRWVHLNVGAFHGLIESLETGTALPFPMSLERPSTAELVKHSVTGPTCDTQDTIRHNVELPSDVTVGDIVLIGCAGAYTNAYTQAFNGFPVPVVEVIENTDSRFVRR